MGGSGGNIFIIPKNPEYTPSVDEVIEIIEYLFKNEWFTGDSREHFFIDICYMSYASQNKKKEEMSKLEDAYHFMRSLKWKNTSISIIPRLLASDKIKKELNHLTGEYPNFGFGYEGLSVNIGRTIQYIATNADTEEGFKKYAKRVDLVFHINLIFSENVLLLHNLKERIKRIEAIPVINNLLQFLRTTLGQKFEVQLRVQELYDETPP